MRSVNKVILIGNIVRDPEIKDTGNEQKLCTFSLATNREWYAGEGDGRNKKSLAEFHNITAWGRVAEKCHKFLKKGKLVYVEGYLKTRKFDNDDGTRSYRTEVVIYDMIMLDKKGEGSEEGEDEMPEMERESLNASASDVSVSLDEVGSGTDDDNVF